MATAENSLGGGLRGRIDGLSFYKRRGSDKTIVRKSSGHTKEKVRHDPDLDVFRRHGSEFGGRSKMSKYLMRALYLHKPVADHNIAGPLNALLKPLQQLDTISEFSKRNIILSAHPHFVKGFSLNRQHPFDSVIRHPIACQVDRETAAARIFIPALMPLINFIPPVSHPYYALRVSLAIVPDIVFKVDRYAPVHEGYAETLVTYTDTAWFPVLRGSAPMELALQHTTYPPDGNFTLVVGISIFYGVLEDVNKIEQVPYAGSAKILEVG